MLLLFYLDLFIINLCYLISMYTKILVSVASGEDPAFTPKTRKDMISGYHSHPATPQSTVPSPGAASINSIHEEYPDLNSPSWPRTPASPVCLLVFIYLF